MPSNLNELIEEIIIINEQFDIKANEEGFLEQLNENGRNVFNNMTIAFKDMEARYTKASTYLVPESKINNANTKNSISSIKSGLKTPDNYNNYNIGGNFSKGFAFLANLASAMPLPVAESSDRLRDAARSLSASIGQYQSRYEKNIEELESKNKSLDLAIDDIEEQKFYIKEQWDELEKSIQENKKSLDQQYSELQSDFLNNQTDRSAIFDSFMQDLQEEKSKITKQIENEFDSEKNNYLLKVGEDKEKLFEEWERNFQDSTSKFNSEFENSKDNFDSESTELIENLRNKQKEAASIVGNVANNGIAGHFAKEAKDKKSSARLWRFSTIGAFVITIIAGFLLLILQVGSEDNNLHVTELISRIVVTAALGSLTAYLSKLASNDEKSRKYNSSMEIRLRTLNPYLDSFESEEKIQLKKDLFPIIFQEEEKDYQKNKDNNSVTKDG